jgi:hypothetical protein
MPLQECHICGLRGGEMSPWHVYTYVELSCNASKEKLIQFGVPGAVPPNPKVEEMRPSMYEQGHCSQVLKPV